MTIGSLFAFGSLLVLLGVVISAVFLGGVDLLLKQVQWARLERAWLEQARSVRRRAEQAQSELARLERRRRLEWRRLEQKRLARRQREQRLARRRERLERLRSAHFLLAIAVQLLPPSERDRYLEEFRAELLDVQRDARLRHARSLLLGVIVLRLRRGLKNKVADAAVRRVKD